jgi:hypothetical protein
MKKAILTIVAGLAIHVQAQSFLTNGLVAYYPFTGNANDASGNGNDGTVYGAALTTNRFGIPNSAYYFNGTSDYIKTLEALPDMQSASVSFWISLPKLPHRVGDYVFMDGDATGGSDFFVTLWSNNIAFMTKDGVNLIGSLPPPFTNTWFHVVAVADNNTQELKIWLNGQLNSTSTSLGNANVGFHTQLYIGCRAVYVDNFFNGAIDDLRIYNRALSNSEVQQLYLYESGLSCVSPPTGLVAWWRGGGNADDTAGANNGSLSGGVTFTNGEVGQAFAFDGVNGSAIVPDSPSLRLTNQLTIEAWINPRSTNSDQPILSKLSYATGNNGYQLAFAYDVLYGQFNSPGQPWPSSRVTYGGPIAPNVWQHVAFTYDHSAMVLYFNGLPVATNVIGPATIATSSSTLCIGGNEGNPVYFDGLIDEPSVYNRALSASEVAAIYNAGSAGKCARPTVTTEPTSQVGYWGKDVTFTVTAGGTEPFSYQWQWNGVPIAGATESSLVLTNLQATNAGIYSVVVTDAHSSITSSNAYLTVNPAGVSLALYAGITIDGVVGLTYGIQYTTNLSDTNSWQGIANITLSVPTELWFDVQPANRAKRFYRVVPGPISIP